jgi:hypothetical protein
MNFVASKIYGVVTTGITFQGLMMGIGPIRGTREDRPGMQVRSTAMTGRQDRPTGLSVRFARRGGHPAGERSGRRA